jgi:hypothetical protein
MKDRVAARGTAISLPSALLLALVVAGVLLYVALGSRARTPFQLLAAAVCTVIGLFLLRGRLGGRVLATLSAERFYLLAIGIDAFIVANVRNTLPSGSVERWGWIAVAGLLAAAYAAGYLVERRRAREPS